MIRSRSLLASLAAATLLATAASAGATIADFTIATSDGDGYGQFTYTGSGSQVTVTGLDGTFDGVAITGLSGYASADQQLFLGSTPAFDFSGLSFTVAGGEAFNLSNYGGGPAGGIADSVDDPGGSGCCQGSITSFTIAAPEPQAWTLMIVGVGLAGAAIRSRRRSLHAAA